MATKPEIIESILGNDKNTLTFEELDAKNYKTLNGMLNDLEKSDSTEDEDKAEGVDYAEVEAKIRAEMEAKLRAEMEVKIRAEVMAEAPKKTEIDRHRLVPVMNMTNGKLIYVSKKTGAKWVWASYGDVDEIEFYELQSMKTGYKGFINDPLLLILDDEVVKYMGLESTYENVLKYEDLEALFRMNNNDFKELVDSAPKAIIVAIVSRAREKIADETLESMWKVKYLNEKFNLQLGQRG